MLGKYNGLCDKCGTEIKWEGHFSDKPPCPGCGKQVDKETLIECEKKLQQAAKEQSENQIKEQVPKRPLIGRGRKNKR